MKVSFLKSAFQPGHYPPPDRPEIAFAGRSNVGKSSLINRLVNRKGLARTGSRPGRTQSINFFLIDDRLYFVDLPGYGFARVPVEVRRSWKEMVEGYLGNRPNLKAVVVIMDIRRGVGEGDLALLNWLKYAGITAVPVLTKTDKMSRSRSLSTAGAIQKELGQVSGLQPILFSAKTGEGAKEIWERIEELARNL